jgi:citronellol/citronellal dehydrogenase
VEALTLSLSGSEPDVGFVAAAIGRFDTESLRKYPDVVLRGAARSVPLQRLGRMEEFGWLVALLASPAGRALDGSVVTLDGGADNWTGPWPPPAMTDDEGTVPTEERR